MRKVVVLFGEAEKGEWNRPHKIRKLPELMDRLGNPPRESLGLFFAIQALLYQREVIYFRVQEEGFSKDDYFLSLRTLKNREVVQRMHALFMPGVGNREILDAFSPVCAMHKSILMTTERDLYDYLTEL